MQKFWLKIASGILLCQAMTVFATEAAKNAAVNATVSNATGSMFKMLVGLAVVLLVLALITWAMKKFVPNVNSQHSVIRVIGGASVGTRERVVVLEVANRWIVVGVAAGQVTSLANLEAGAVASSNAPESAIEKLNLNKVSTKSFAKWLKASSEKLTEGKDKKDA